MLVAERKHGVKAPATDSLVAGANWESKDISGEQHTRVEFATVDLTEAKNTGAIFTECTFRNCKFNVSSHKDGAFVNCTFRSCSFFDTKFHDCKFVGSMSDRYVIAICPAPGCTTRTSRIATCAAAT